MVYSACYEARNVVLEAFYENDNLDRRSFWLNFEKIFFVYNREFTQPGKGSQQLCLQPTTRYDCERFRKCSFVESLGKSSPCRVSPLL